MKGHSLSIFISSGIYVIVGLALLLMPPLFNSQILYFLAIAGVILEIVIILGIVIATKQELGHDYGPDKLIFWVGIGAVILVQGGLDIFAFTFILGVMTAFKGLSGIHRSKNLKFMGYGNYKNSLLVSAAFVVYGAFMMSNPEPTDMVIRLHGAGVLASGAGDILLQILIERHLKRAAALGEEEEEI